MNIHGCAMFLHSLQTSLFHAGMIIEAPIIANSLSFSRCTDSAWSWNNDCKGEARSRVVISIFHNAADEARLFLSLFFSPLSSSFFLECFRSVGQTGISKTIPCARSYSSLIFVDVSRQCISEIPPRRAKLSEFKFRIMREILIAVINRII